MHKNYPGHYIDCGTHLDYYPTGKPGEPMKGQFNRILPRFIVSVIPPKAEESPAEALALPEIEEQPALVEISRTPRKMPVASKLTQLAKMDGATRKAFLAGGGSL